MAVRDDRGHPVEVAGGRLRALLTRLAIGAGQLVTTEALIDAVWADQPPAGAANALQSLVSRLRRVLGPDGPIEALPAGYRLTAEVDLHEFERLIGAARPAEALRLVRGQPFADVPAPPGLVARVTEQRLSAAEDLAERQLAGDLADGTIRRAIEELHALVAEHPARERARRLHVRALVAVGRPAEALASYEEHRKVLAETLGADPAPDLRELHTRILRGETSNARVNSTGNSTVDRGPGNLRTPLTSFVGRAEELARVRKALATSRLVTLVGPGGAGKTRLATELGLETQHDATHHEATQEVGIWLVELAGIGDGAEVPAAVLAALGHREGGMLNGAGEGIGGLGRSPLERVTNVLRDRRALLILDNCEHLLDACARLVDAVLGAAPEVRVLVTTREPLGITGEVLCPLGPLAVPPSTVEVEASLGYPSVRLLVDRARAIRHDFAVTAENLPDVVEVCRRLDGLPLAIELAAARLRTLPLAEVAARLGDRFRLLTGGSRTALPRHQTLQAVIGWSWDLLTPDEQCSARRLAVFAGGAALDAAEAVCGEDAASTLDGLVEKSFVQLQEGPDGRARYAMLDSVRAFSTGQLSDAGEAEPVRSAHAAWFLDRLELAEPALRTGEQLVWLGWIEREYDNVTAALRWAVDTGDAVVAVRLVSALGWYWVLRGGRGEPTAWLGEVLALPGVAEAPPSSLATAYAYDAMHRFSGSDPARAGASARRALRLAEHVGRHPAVAFVTAIMRSPSPDMNSVLNGLSELAGHPEPWVAAAGRLVRGHVAENGADAAGAAGSFAAARDAFAALGDRWGMTMALTALGGNLGLHGDHAGAVAALTEAAELAQAIGAESDAAWSRARCGLERLRAGDLAGAEEDFDRTWADGVATHASTLLALAGIGRAELARLRGDPATARATAVAALSQVDSTVGMLNHRLRTMVHLSLARSSLELGDDPRQWAAAALEDVRTLGDTQSGAELLELWAELALAAGEPAVAAEHLGLAAALRGTPDAGSPDVRAAAERGRAALGPAFDEAYARAATRPVEQAREHLAALAAG